MSQQIISQRIGCPLALVGTPVFAASGTAQYIQPSPTVNGPLVFSQQDFPGNEVMFSGPFWPAPLQKFRAYQDSIFVKRWRFYSNLPSSFFFIRPDTAAHYISLLWSTNWPGFDWTTQSDQIQRIFSLFQATTAFGEWHDINMMLPKSAILRTVPDGPGTGIVLGTFIPSCTFFYQGVPTPVQGQSIEIRMEVEIAHTLSDFNWNGDL